MEKDILTSQAFAMDDTYQRRSIHTKVFVILCSCFNSSAETKKTSNCKAFIILFLFRRCPFVRRCPSLYQENEDDQISKNSDEWIRINAHNDHILAHGAFPGNHL